MAARIKRWVERCFIDVTEKYEMEAVVPQPVW
jgi:hypothetical protein